MGAAGPIPTGTVGLTPPSTYTAPTMDGLITPPVPCGQGEERSTPRPETYQSRDRMQKPVLLPTCREGGERPMPRSEKSGLRGEALAAVPLLNLLRVFSFQTASLALGKAMPTRRMPRGTAPHVRSPRWPCRRYRRTTFALRRQPGVDWRNPRPWYLMPGGRRQGGVSRARPRPSRAVPPRRAPVWSPRILRIEVLRCRRLPSRMPRGPRRLPMVPGRVAVLPRVPPLAPRVYPRAHRAGRPAPAAPSPVPRTIRVALPTVLWSHPAVRPGTFRRTPTAPWPRFRPRSALASSARGFALTQAASGAATSSSAPSAPEPYYPGDPWSRTCLTCPPLFLIKRGEETETYQ